MVPNMRLFSELNNVADNVEPTLSPAAFRSFRKLIMDQAGINLGENKHQLVASRLRKRVVNLGFTDYESYYGYITSPCGREDGEYQACIDTLTTNETYFFREIEHFKFLQARLPELRFNARYQIEGFKAWSAACSSGEEPYSLAMTCDEELGSHLPWKIRATDISSRMLSTGKQAIYPESRCQRVPFNYKKRYMLKGTGDYQGMTCVAPVIRDKVQFENFNLIHSVLPQTKYDVIFCRNVLIYFDQDTRLQVVRRLITCLKPKGLLFVGVSEGLQLMDLPIISIGPSIYQVKDYPKNEHPREALQ